MCSEITDNASTVADAALLLLLLLLLLHCEALRC